MDEKWANGKVAELAEFIVFRNLNSISPASRASPVFCLRLFYHFGHNVHPMPCFNARNVPSFASSIVLRCRLPDAPSAIYPQLNRESFAATCVSTTATFRAHNTPEYVLVVRERTSNSCTNEQLCAEEDNPSEDLAF